MMHLRRLFYGRIGALRRERALLLHRVPSGAAETAPDAATRLADINDIAQQLHDNGAAEFRAYMQLSAAYCRGVSSGVLRKACAHNVLLVCVEMVEGLGQGWV